MANIQPQNIEIKTTKDCFDDVQTIIKNVCDEICNLLISKNQKYGNSALEPKRIFSRSDTIEQINVRIDDKLSRIANRKDDEDEDVELDLIGYLILKRVAIQIKQENINN